MKKLKRILVVTFVILLTQVFNIQAACYWDVSTSQTDCGIWCVASGSEIPEDVMALLYEKWNEVTKKDFYFIRSVHICH